MDVRGGHWIVVRGGALGDFVVTVPAIREARARAERLTLVADPRFASPWRELFDEVVDIRGREALWLFGDLPAPFVPDAALAYTPGVAERLQALGVPNVLTAAPMPTRRAHQHFFEPFGGDAPPPRLLPDPTFDFPPTIVLAPGAGSPAKVWPGFDALGRDLTARGLPWRFLVGPDDPARPGAWTGLSLREVAALAARSIVWVGNDSGPTHLRTPSTLTLPGRVTVAICTMTTAVVSIASSLSARLQDSSPSPIAFGSWARTRR